MAQRRAAALRPVPEDKDHLYRIIETIGAGPDLDTILAGVVRLVSEATGTHACFIYFVQGTQLVLRAASGTYAHLRNRIHFSTGQGLTGWVVRTRRSAFIPENALDDPRVHYVPEMEEERFQSVASVPVFSRSGDVIAVINVHTEAPREFAPADLEFLEHTASLVAGAIDNARLYDAATEQVSLLTDLSRLSQQIASAQSPAALLATVTSGSRRVLGAERVEVHLVGGDGRLALAAADPHGPEGAIDDFPGTPVAAPLTAGGEEMGVLRVHLPEDRTHVGSVAAAIAAHTAVALKHHELVERLREENLVKDFFEALARGQGEPDELALQAGRLGLDLGEPHAVLHAAPWTGPRPGRTRRRPEGPASWTDLVAGLEASLLPALPGTVFDRRPSSWRAVVPLPPGGEAALARAAHTAYSRAAGRHGWMAIGISDPASGPAAFPRAFEEAASAAEVGALIRGAPGAFTFEDLGPYRYVLGAGDSVSDRHQQRLEHLVDYDARRGTELLRTLEAYLDGRGNMVGTARTLHTHPNTLRQRLARIRQLSGIDPEAEDWLSLGIAVKLVKLRLARRSAERSRGGHRG